MSVATPPVKPDRTKLALAQTPPDEQFWNKYSPHFEFQISTFATGAIHVVLVAILIYVTTRLMKEDETTPVPVRGLTLTQTPTGGLSGEQGAGGGEPKTEASDERPEEPRRQIPEAQLQKEMISARDYLPELKDPDLLKKFVSAPNYDKLRDLNDELKKRSREGFGGGKGMGEEKGKGTEPGTGDGSPGDPTTSGNRSMRWTIVFKTNNGADYLKQTHCVQGENRCPGSA